MTSSTPTKSSDYPHRPVPPAGRRNPKQTPPGERSSCSLLRPFPAALRLGLRRRPLFSPFRFVSSGRPFPAALRLGLRRRRCCGCRCWSCIRVWDVFVWWVIVSKAGRAVAPPAGFPPGRRRRTVVCVLFGAHCGFYAPPTSGKSTCLAQLRAVAPFPPCVRRGTPPSGKTDLQKVGGLLSCPPFSEPFGVSAGGVFGSSQFLCIVPKKKMLRGSDRKMPSISRPVRWRVQVGIAYTLDRAGIFRCGSRRSAWKMEMA